MPRPPMTPREVASTYRHELRMNQMQVTESLFNAELATASALYDAAQRPHALAIHRQLLETFKGR